MNEARRSLPEACSRLQEVLQQLEERTRAGAPEAEISRLNAEAKKLNDETGAGILSGLEAILARARHDLTVKGTALAADYLRKSPPLLDSDSVVVATACPKVSAMCLDRVWSPYAPPEVRFFGGLDAETELLSFMLFAGTPEYEKVSEVAAVLGLSAGSPFLEYLPSVLQALKSESAAVQTTFHVLAGLLSRETDGPVPVVYSSPEVRTREHGAGDRAALVAVLTNLRIVDEDATDWEQVVEFRSGQDAKRKLKRLVHWLDKDMVANSPEFIAEDIAERLEAYEGAMRKHGIDPVIGNLSSIVDHQSLIAATTAAAVANIAAGEFWAAVAGVGVLSARAGLHVAKELLDLKDLKRTTNPEVAFVLEARQRLGAT